MAALTDPISGLSYGWALGEDNWNTGMDANLVKIGAMLHINVLGFVASPSITTNGTRYIVTTGSGAFAGQNNKLAARVAGAWVFYTLPEGCVVYDEDTNLHYKFEGGSYVLLVDLSALTSATAAWILTPTINMQFNGDYTLQPVDNDGKTYLRMHRPDANKVLVPLSQTRTITIRQSYVGITTLVAGTGVTLNGNPVFSGAGDTKTLVPIYVDGFESDWDIIGATA